MLQKDDKSVETPAWDGVPRQVAELWRMQKGVHVAICALWTHADGAELRLMVDGKLRASDASHHTWALEIVALGWRERLEWLNGWS
jgi:hypothetical protein